MAVARHFGGLLTYDSMMTHPTALPLRPTQHEFKEVYSGNLTSFVVTTLPNQKAGEVSNRHSRA